MTISEELMHIITSFSQRLRPSGCVLIATAIESNARVLESPVTAPTAAAPDCFARSPAPRIGLIECDTLLTHALTLMCGPTPTDLGLYGYVPYHGYDRELALSHGGGVGVLWVTACMLGKIQGGWMIWSGIRRERKRAIRCEALSGKQNEGCVCEEMVTTGEGTHEWGECVRSLRDELPARKAALARQPHTPSQRRCVHFGVSRLGYGGGVFGECTHVQILDTIDILDRRRACG